MAAWPEETPIIHTHQAKGVHTPAHSCILRCARVPVSATVRCCCRLSRPQLETLQGLHSKGISFGDVSSASIGKDRAGKPYLIDYSLATKLDKATTTTYAFAG